ncbi:MAG: FKBP-type peptidyl-prolyl cis-trans isomerase [Sphingobacteriales bacterium]|nr:FKBP-type peptidyl-prolyl cis-trans isomerase [Sphingobacteriales bacterium]
MKQFIVILSVFFVLISGMACLKDNSCKAKTVESEKATMLSYAASNGITATEHSSGIMYQVVTAGSGPAPTLSSTVSVRYTGKLLDGTVFDSQTGNPISFPLNQVIPGWQIGLPLIQEGGLIKLIIPSSLCYGCTGVGAIPGNSVLYFEIQLVDVQ